jgi:hypothetical protein
VIKQDLENAVFENSSATHVSSLTSACNGLTSAVQHLATGH